MADGRPGRGSPAGSERPAGGSPDPRARGPALALLAVLGACAHEPTTLRGTTMGTTWAVTWTGATDATVLQSAITAWLAQFAGVFSTWDPESELSRCNADRSGAPFPASPALAAMARRALALAQASDGAFDPTVLPLLRVLGLGPRRGQELDPAAAAAARSRVGWWLVQVDAEGRIVRERPDLELTFDAIAPGVAVDEVGALLERHGVRSYVVEIGGEVLCRGEKRTGVPWTVGIERAAGAEHDVLELVPLRDRALATSGSYRNFVEAGGRRRHHILDPRTGENATHATLGVSVVASTCALADGLATALMVVGPAGAETLLARAGDPGARALFQMADASLVRVRW